jgi:hypothetical protein
MMNVNQTIEEHTAFISQLNLALATGDLRDMCAVQDEYAGRSLALNEFPQEGTTTVVTIDNLSLQCGSCTLRFYFEDPNHADAQHGKQFTLSSGSIGRISLLPVDAYKPN